MTVTNGHSFQFSTSEWNFETNESEEMQAAEPFDAFDM